MNPSDITRALRQMLDAATTNLQAFSIVDGALLFDLPETVCRRWAALQPRSLLTGASQGAAEVGPLLYALSATHLNADLPATLLDLVSGCMAGSVIVSSHDAGELQRRLSPLADVKLADGSNMVMRYFDPRVLPFWIDALTPNQHQYIAGAVQQWACWGVDFEVKVHSFNAATPALPEPVFPINLSVDQEEALLTACYPFTLIERLRAEDPAALSRVPMASRYKFFQEQSMRAQAHGLLVQGELEAYCSTAAEFGPRFDEDEAVKAAFAGLKEGKAFHEALATVSNADWQRMREYR